MNPAIRFLHSLSHALAATTLYGPGHPARLRAVQSCYEALRLLQSQNEDPSFSFLGRDVIYGYDALRELRDWEWSMKLASVGIQRIEIVTDVSPEDFAVFMEEIHARLTSGGNGAAGDDKTNSLSREQRSRQASIRFGAIGIQGSAKGGVTTDLPTGDAVFTLKEESEAVRYIHGQVTGQASIPLVEAEAVVRSLSVALHADGRLLIPLLRIKSFDQYTTSHSINVAVLSMALAEALGHSPRDIRAIGVAGLLHDLGKVRVPPEILTKPGSLSPEEREILERHPGDGARIILNSDRRLTLPAAVAFEHHVMINGGGYPRRTFSRDCHYASTLVHVCDVFDALHTERPYRAAWPSAKALYYIERRAGREFDPTIASSFIALMRQNERAVGVVTETAPVRANGAGAPAASALTPGVSEAAVPPAIVPPAIVPAVVSAVPTTTKPVARSQPAGGTPTTSQPRAAPVTTTGTGPHAPPGPAASPAPGIVAPASTPASFAAPPRPGTPAASVTPPLAAGIPVRPTAPPIATRRPTPAVTAVVPNGAPSPLPHAARATPAATPTMAPRRPTPAPFAAVPTDPAPSPSGTTSPVGAPGATPVSSQVSGPAISAVPPSSPQPSLPAAPPNVALPAAAVTAPQAPPATTVPSPATPLTAGSSPAQSARNGPGTEALTTEAPTTEAPTTEAPTTEAPTTQAPTTQAPAAPPPPKGQGH